MNSEVKEWKLTAATLVAGRRARRGMKEYIMIR
jgi:hypothetical protein